MLMALHTYWTRLQVPIGEHAVFVHLGLSFAKHVRNLLLPEHAANATATIHYATRLSRVNGESWRPTSPLC